MENVTVENDGTFKANFTVDGELKLRERVNSKLKELIGDSTDEILVDYIIMLLKNGRRKEEARNQLNHILGDDSASFVSWLWNHLILNLDLYLQKKDSQELDDQSHELTKTEIKNEGNENEKSNSNSEIEISQKNFRRRRNIGWKELAKREDEPPPLRSSEVFGNIKEKKNRVKIDEYSCSSSSSSSCALVENRRVNNRGYLGKRKTKMGGVLQESVNNDNNPPRRLLQSAIRDTLPPWRSTPSSSRPSFSGSRLQPALKRVRYVVFKPHHHGF